jgi:protein tyrosine phosphatase (PTP) superfamily phosphohydrolase (DUF442 family)
MLEAPTVAPESETGPADAAKPSASAALQPAAARTGRWKRAALWGLLAGLLLALAREAGFVLVGRNFHVILPGRAYRSAQLSSRHLEEAVQRHGIRTVINLRGAGDPLPWYVEESRATCRLDIAQEDICLSAFRLPAVTEVRRLLEVLERCEYPILVHCRRGADRTGLVAGMILLLAGGADVAEARQQLGWRFGHVSLGKTAGLARFFDQYEEYLQARGLEHGPQVFRRWLVHDYCPDACRARIEILRAPPRARVGRFVVVQARFHNTSPRPWHFRAADNAGVHAGFLVVDGRGECICSGRGGLFDTVVAPGQSIDLPLIIPGIARPGKYQVCVDMLDEKSGWFYQAGSEAKRFTLCVRPHLEATERSGP